MTDLKLTCSKCSALIETIVGFGASSYELACSGCGAVYRFTCEQDGDQRLLTLDGVGDAEPGPAVAPEFQGGIYAALGRLYLLRQYADRDWETFTGLSANATRELAKTLRGETVVNPKPGSTAAALAHREEQSNG